MMTIRVIPDEQFFLGQELTPLEIKQEYSSLETDRLKFFEIIRLPKDQYEFTHGYIAGDIVLANPDNTETITLGKRNLVFIFMDDIFAKVDKTGGYEDEENTEHFV